MRYLNNNQFIDILNQSKILFLLLNLMFLKNFILFLLINIIILNIDFKFNYYIFY